MKTLLFLLLLSSVAAQGQVYSLLDILSRYGYVIPDIQPATHNHYQVHGLNPNFTFINYSREGISDNELPNMSDFLWEWQLQGDTLFGTSIPFSNISWSCNGNFKLGMTGTDIHTEAVFYREIPAYVIWYDIPYPECDEGVSFEEISFYGIWEDFSPYEYLITYSPYDLNQDNVINVYDILQLLTQ